MLVVVLGFDWDDGNWPKCGKHGVGRDEIERVLRNMNFRIPDPNPVEARFRTAGRTEAGRTVFIVFTHRDTEKGRFIRAVSARYMHAKEVEQYEQLQKAMANPQKR